MASLMVAVLAVICTLVPGVKNSGDLLKLECDSAVGIAVQTTVIACRFRPDNKDVQIDAVSLKKATQDSPVFQQIRKNIIGDHRISLENPVIGPSLQISNTMFSDAGVYEYDLVTNKGNPSAKFAITVTAKYKDPIISTWPENITDGGPVDLYCNATEGYPAGTIHWFDRYQTNWTINSILTKVTKDTNSTKSVTLSSKLTFKSIDSSLAPFRCIVFNYKYIQEGEKTLQITPAKQKNENTEESKSNTTKIVAGVMVIGSLIAGVLFALLFCLKRRSPDNSWRGQKVKWERKGGSGPGKDHEPGLELGSAETQPCHGLQLVSLIKTPQTFGVCSAQEEHTYVSHASP